MPFNAKIELSRWFSLMNMTDEDISTIDDLFQFFRAMLPSYTSLRNSPVLLPFTLYAWLKHNNYLVEWKDMVLFTSLSNDQAKNSLFYLYEHFPFEFLNQDMGEICREYLDKILMLFIYMYSKA